MLRVALLGASGYAGEELLRLLLRHPEVKITYLAAKLEKDTPVGEIFPHLKEKLSLLCHAEFHPEEAVKNADLFFLALPHTVSLQYVPCLLERGKKVIDLSADYRFDEAKTYEDYYTTHSSPELLKEKVYGLPEIYRKKIRKARLVANPGCYPTSVILALAPLLKKRWTKNSLIIADSKSGISGAGRIPKLPLHFCEISQNFWAYSVASHRHQPEMEQELSKLAGKEIKVIFVPQVIPVNRGIFTTLYVKTDKREKEIFDLYQEFYHGEPFIQILPPGSYPQLSHIKGTNLCIIGMKEDKRTGYLVLMSAIDNLTKGAGGQAIQNMNIMYGWEETLGLKEIPLLP